MAIEKIDYNLCNGCGQCVNTCWADVFRMDEKTQKAVIRYPENCRTCYYDLCQYDCPQHAIYVSPAQQAVVLTLWGIGD
jgi:NAD-dependent dihydropyrimidine dehydrogenase PreA subunit